MKINLREFIRSEDTEFGLRVILGGGIPLFLLTFLGYPREGLMIMVGSTFISGIDIPAELPRKLRLMTYSLIATPLVFMAISLAHPYPILLYPLLAGFIFVFSFLAPFSFHFGKVAFMSNLAIMLSLGFATNLTGTTEIFRSAGLLFIGGLWYMAFASLMHFIQRPVQVTRRISNVLQHTAGYFKTRSALFDPDADHHQLLLELTKRQAELTDTHEKVRAMMMQDFDYSRQTNSRLGRMLHFFAAVVDLFDEALATSWRIQETSGIQENQSIKKLLFDINGSIAQILKKLESHLNGELPLEELKHLRQEVKSKTTNLESELNAMRKDLQEHGMSGDEYHAYKPIQLYIQEQMDTLEYMIGILEGTASIDHTNIQAKDLPHFETKDQLRLEQMRSHLTFRSGYFRYALRVVVTAMTAYFIVMLLGFQNPNWALFTVLVILKPGYRVSKKRLIYRVVGTSIGVFIAYGLFIIFHPGHLISSVIFLIAFFGGFAFMSRNYAVASVFFTMYILFLYVFLDRNFEMSALFRFTNTLLAAILSIFSIRLLFPYWENNSTKYYLVNALRATKNYLSVIYEELKNPESNLTAYRVARKDAQLAMGEFTHMYQRILSEPKSKRGDISELSAWILHTSSILAVCSNIGLFLRREPNYILDQRYLKDYFDWIITYYDEVVQSIEQHTPMDSTESSLEVLRDLKEDHDRLKTDINRLASGYSEIYIARVHEYFIIHEILTLYHLIERIHDTTEGSPVLAEGSVHIEYS